MSESSSSGSWERYFIPGTDVLRNLFIGPGTPFGEPDQRALTLMENAITAIRLRELDESPIPGQFDYVHMKAIHHHIFQDVYEWAGQERTAPTEGPMSKHGHLYYPAGPGLTAAAEAGYKRLARQNHLRGLPLSRFVSKLADAWAELNVVHSFREGNTRTQFVFFAQLTDRAGFALLWRRFRPGTALRDEFVLARFQSQDTGDNSRLTAVLRQTIAAISPGNSAPRPPM